MVRMLLLLSVERCRTSPGIAPNNRRKAGGWTVGARKLFVLAVAAAGCAINLPAEAAYKCITKNGVTYQGTPCVEATQQAEIGSSAVQEAERVRFAMREAQRTQQEREASIQDKQRLAVDRRKADEADQYREWVERT